MGSLPCHPPEAAQLVAWMLLHVKLLAPPDAIDAGDAASETVGAGVAVPEKITSSTESVRQEVAAESLMLIVCAPLPSDTVAP